MLPLVVTIPSSPALVSSAVTLDRAHRPITVLVPSFGTAAYVTAQFATVSGGGADGWFTANQKDGSANPWFASSGAATPAATVLEYPSTPYMRLVISSAQVTATSFTVLAVLR